MHFEPRMPDHERTRSGRACGRARRDRIAGIGVGVGGMTLLGCRVSKCNGIM